MSLGTCNLSRKTLVRICYHLILKMSQIISQLLPVRRRSRISIGSRICNDEIREHIPTLPKQLIPSPAIPTFAVNPIVPIPPIMTSTAANLVPDSSLAPDHSMATRGKVRLRKLNPKYALHISTDTGIPSGVGRALEDQDWYAAMNTEYQALMANQTWELVRCSPEQNVLSSK